VVNKLCPAKFIPLAPHYAVRRQIHAHPQCLEALYQGHPLVTIARNLADQHRACSEMRDEYVRLASINIPDANHLEMIESARINQSVKFLVGEIDSDQYSALDSVLDNHLRCLGGSESMVLHTGGCARKDVLFTLVGSYCSTEEFLKNVDSMDQASVERGNFKFPDGKSFMNFIRFQTKRFMDKNGIDYTPQDEEDAVNEYRVVDLYSKVFDSYGIFSYQQRLEKKTTEMFEFSERMQLQHEQLQHITEHSRNLHRTRQGLVPRLG
jgi:hypothetical protein